MKISKAIDKESTYYMIPDDIGFLFYDKIMNKCCFQVSIIAASEKEAEELFKQKHYTIIPDPIYAL